MTDISRETLNIMKRALNRFHTDEEYAQAIKECAAKLMIVCDDMDEVAGALNYILVMAKENWSLKSEVKSAKTQNLSQK